LCPPLTLLKKAKISSNTRTCNRKVAKDAFCFKSCRPSGGYSATSNSIKSPEKKQADFVGLGRPNRLAREESTVKTGANEPFLLLDPEGPRPKSFFNHRNPESLTEYRKLPEEPRRQMVTREPSYRLVNAPGRRGKGKLVGSSPRKPKTFKGAGEPSSKNR